MSIKCWLGFHNRTKISRFPDKDAGMMKYGFWYTYTFRCNRCQYTWKESPKPFD
jgi:hypothetical protein